MLTAVLLAPLAVLLGQVLGRDGLAIVPTATTVGVLAAVVLARLARHRDRPRPPCRLPRMRRPLRGQLRGVLRLDRPGGVRSGNLMRAGSRGRVWCRSARL